MEGLSWSGVHSWDENEAEPEFSEALLLLLLQPPPSLQLPLRLLLLPPLPLLGVLLAARRVGGTC